MLFNFKALKWLPHSAGMTVLGLVAFLNFFSPHPARAQSSLPEVEIDTSVLEELDRQLGQSAGTAAPVLRPPTSAAVKPASAMLTAPEIENFPIQVKTRSESADPGLEKTVRAPLPPKKPSGTIAALAKVPTPPRRPVAETKPDITPEISKASPEFVAQARAQNGLPPLEKIKNAGTSPYKIMGKNGPAMPALPKSRVYAEPLAAEDAAGIEPAAGMEDDVLVNLATPDRQKIVDTIKAISQGKAPPAPAPKKTVVSSALPLKKTVSAPAQDITASFPVSAPPHPAAATKEETIELAALNKPEPIDITDDSFSSPVDKPAMQEEEQGDSGVITLSFQPGLTDLDATVKGALEERVLPRLKDNPGVRLQIESYAGEEKRQAGSDRRTSLSRALSVRTYLLNNGIEPNRMDIRALGKETGRQPLDRVDLVFADPTANVDN